MTLHHDAYNKALTDQTLLAQFYLLLEVLEQQLDEAEFVRKIAFKGNRAGQQKGCLVQGFLVEHAWLPTMRVALELVYFSGGIQLQLATYPEYENIVQQTSLPENTPDLVPKQFVTLSTLGVYWEGVAGPSLLRSREADLLSMLNGGNWRLPNNFAQFLAGLLEQATP